MFTLKLTFGEEAHFYMAGRCIAEIVSKCSASQLSLRILYLVVLSRYVFWHPISLFSLMQHRVSAILALSCGKFWANGAME